MLCLKPAPLKHCHALFCCCGSRSLYHEDHTIGNTLRYMLNKNPDVSFVGYSVPHPAEPKMNLRLQTVGPPATDTLLDTLNTVHKVGEHVLATFDAAVADFRKNGGGMDAGKRCGR